MQAFLQKLIAIFMSILAFLGLAKKQENAAPPGSYTVNGSKVEFCLDSNPTTGYGWTARCDGDCVQLTGDEYVATKTDPQVAGAGGFQYYTFTAVKEGTAAVTFTYARSWETNPPIRTVTARITVAADLSVTVTDYREA